jgi:hypothetical protein
MCGQPNQPLDPTALSARVFHMITVPAFQVSPELALGRRALAQWGRWAVMIPVRDALLLSLAFILLAGCTSSSRTTTEPSVVQQSAAVEIVPGRSVYSENWSEYPPFGAEVVRPDAVAPEWMVEKAKAFHSGRRKASLRFPYFQFCQHRQEAPGYEAKFCRHKTGGAYAVSITYYFDEEGRFLEGRALLCTGY